VERLVGAERLQRSLFRADNTLDRIADRLFGRGLETWDSITLPEHELDDRLAYVPSAWHVLPRALRYIGVSDRDTFVDFGCGKGRVVHQAARYPFRRVIGVEVSSELAEIARAGLAARSNQHRCGEVEIVVADAAHFQVPDDLTIAYFFRPFGEETFGAVLQRIVESIDRNPRRVRLIYLWPMNSASTIVATDRFRLVKQQSSSLIHRRKDRIAIFESC
jgi:SAM-dependent methyltransferase